MTLGPKRTYCVNSVPLRILQYTLVSRTPGIIEISSSYPKFVLTGVLSIKGFEGDRNSVRINQNSINRVLLTRLYCIYNSLFSDY